MTQDTYQPIERPFDRDRMSMMPRIEAARAAFTALDAVQGLPPEQAVLGTAILFRALCERVGLDPEDLHARAGRILRAPEDGDRPTDNCLQTLQDFASARIAGRQGVTFV